MTSEKLMKKIKKLFEKRGRNVYEAAKKEILDEKIEHKPIRDALQYFMQELWQNFQHPALLSLACESVGGKPEDTNAIGVSLVLLTGAADIHDDIIDQSKTKDSKPTVFGKFGTDIALLAGDALLLKGFMLLHKTCEDLPEKQRETIINLVNDAFFEIGIAEAKEVRHKGSWDLPPEEHLDIIRMKAAIADMTASLGAIIGGGSPDEIEALGKYGRILGMLTTIRDEFIDVFEADELKNRAENECLPLPISYAFRNRKARNKITRLLKKKELTDKDTSEIVETIAKTRENRILKRKMRLLLEEGINSVKNIRSVKTSKMLGKMLYAALEDL